MELSPEERARIYAEEKARLAIRDKLKREKPAGAGWTIAVVILSAFLVLIVIGFVTMLTEKPAGDATSSTPTAAQLDAGCKLTILELERKPASELSINQLRELRFCKTVVEK